MPSKVIEYRAIAQGISRDGHAIQAISQQLGDIDNWSHITADKFNCVVKIYVLRENVLKNVRPTTRKKK
jgi:hypothetical protein